MTGASFARALSRCAARADTPIVVDDHRTVAWYSATFSGERHDLSFSARPGAALDAWLDAWLDRLPTLDLPLHGDLLVEVRIVSREPGDVGDDVRVRIAALTVALA